MIVGVPITGDVLADAWRNSAVSINNDNYLSPWTFLYLINLPNLCVLVVVVVVRLLKG